MRPIYDHNNRQSRQWLESVATSVEGDSLPSPIPCAGYCLHMDDEPDPYSPKALLRRVSAENATLREEGSVTHWWSPVVQLTS